MAMEKLGLIFDVDGTLCDSTEVMKIAWNEILDQVPYHHVKMTDEFISRYMGKPMDEWAKGVLPGLDIDTACEIVRQCSDQEYTEIERIGTNLYPDIQKTFRILHGKYHLYILSNCGIGYIERVMKCAGIEEYVDAHLCNGDTNLDKPDNIRQMVKEQGLTRCAYIGDTERDHECCADPHSEHCIEDCSFHFFPSCWIAIY
ncbi:MAG: HAD family hydrolase [Erysipelotrichia bacterium]|nr:HAD family hydrolase [Erysipelotrichia bacterium]